MINFIDIENTIKELEILYSNSTNTLHQILYSKLAILEYCGWLEDSFDIIADEYITRNVLTSGNQQYIRKISIENNYGFSYENNLRPMLSKVIGFPILEFVENDLESDHGKFTLMKSYIDFFLRQRRNAAHKATSVTMVYDTPSVVLSYFTKLKPILQLFENSIIVVYP